MNKIIRLFRYAGISLVLISLIVIANHVIAAVDSYNEGVLSVNMLEIGTKRETKLLNGAKFTYSNLGTYEIKPTFVQALILSGNGIDEIGPIAIFCLLTGFLILAMVYFKSQSLENLTENALWQCVGAGVILFFVLKFSALYLVDTYVEGITNNAFKHRNFISRSGDFNIEIFCLVVITTIIFELLSYSRNLKQENDLTI